MDDMMAIPFALADKREKLCKNSPSCPECETRQVQLKEWVHGVTWKCRKCKHQWEHYASTV